MTQFAVSEELKNRLRARGGRASTTMALEAAIPDPGLVTMASLAPQMTYLDIGTEASIDSGNLQARLNDQPGEGYVLAMIPVVAAAFSAPNVRYPVAFPTGSIDYLVPGPGPSPGMHLNPTGVVPFVPDALYNLARFDADDLWSVELWLRTTLAPGGPVDVLNKSDGTTWPLRLRLTAAGMIEASRSDGTNTPTVTTTVAVNDGDWHYVSLVKTAPDLSVQVDETTAVTVTDTVTATTVNEVGLTLGSADFDGDVADLGIFEVSLSPAKRTRHRLATLHTPVAA